MTVIVDVLAVVGGLCVACTLVMCWLVRLSVKHDAEKKQLREQLHEVSRKLAEQINHPCVGPPPAAVFKFPVKNTDPWAS